MTEKAEMTAQFLLAEYTSISEKVNRVDQIISSRVNFFLITVGAVAAGITTAMNNDVVRDNIHHIIFLSSFALFLLGIATLHLCQNYSVELVDTRRRAGRIRRWFLKEDRNLAPFLIAQPFDDKPPFALGLKGSMRRGAEPVLIVLNSVLFATIVYLSVKVYASILSNHIGSFSVLQISYKTHQLISCLSSFFGVIFFFIFQLSWVKWRMLKEAEKTNEQGKKIDGIIFPSDEKYVQKLIEKFLKNQK